MKIPAFAILMLLATGCHPRDPAPYADKLVPLIDPERLETLGPRGANPRVQKAIFILNEAHEDGADVFQVARLAVARAGYKHEAAALTANALARNFDIARKLGCLDALGRAAMRQGNAPIVRRGPCAGQAATVDHIVPRAVVPELDKVIANLELLPATLNESKGDKIGPRQLEVARKLHEAGLLSSPGWRRVQDAAR